MPDHTWNLRRRVKAHGGDGSANLTVLPDFESRHSPLGHVKFFRPQKPQKGPPTEHPRALEREPQQG